MMFSAGLPLLLPIAVASFVVSFWVDKIMFVRFYRTPPQYAAAAAAAARWQRRRRRWHSLALGACVGVRDRPSSCRYDMSVGRAASSVLSWAVVVHLIVALVRACACRALALLRSARACVCVCVCRTRCGLQLMLGNNQLLRSSSVDVESQVSTHLHARWTTHTHNAALQEYSNAHIQSRTYQNSYTRACTHKHSHTRMHTRTHTAIHKQLQRMRAPRLPMSFGVALRCF